MDAGDPWDGSPILDFRKLLEVTVESGIRRSCVLVDEGRLMRLQARNASIYPWRGTDLCHPGATGDGMRYTRLVGRKYLPYWMLLQTATGPSGWALFPHPLISVRPQPAMPGVPHEGECAATVICGSPCVQIPRQSADRTGRLRA